MQGSSWTEMAATFALQAAVPVVQLENKKLRDNCKEMQFWTAIAADASIAYLNQAWNSNVENTVMHTLWTKRLELHIAF